MEIENFKRWMEIVNQGNKQDLFSHIFGDEEFDLDNNMISYSEKKQDNNRTETKHENVFPIVDLFQVDNFILLYIELPGIDKNAIDLLIAGKNLIIRGKRKEYSFDNYKSIKTERSYGEFERLIELPEYIDEGNIIAKYENGLLELKLSILMLEEKKISID